MLVSSAAVTPEEPTSQKLKSDERIYVYVLL